MQRLVALILSTASAYGRSVLRGVARFVREHERWTLELVPDWNEQPQRVAGWRGHGIIAQVDSHPFLDALYAFGRPFVNVADLRADLVAPTVISDNRDIGRMAAEHFLARGFRNFAFYGLEDTYYSQLRGEGYRLRVEEAGCRCAWRERREEELESDDWTAVPLVEWLKSLRKPTGLLACNDVVSRLLARRCLAHGVMVPEEVAIVGVDNDETICVLGQVQLSSVAVDGERIGYIAARRLAEQFTGERASDKTILVPPLEVVTRRSTNVLAVGDPVVATAMRFIHDHIRDRPSVNDVAEMVPIGRRTLEKRFRAALGRSVLQEIQRVRVEMARELLVKTDLQMPQVAARAGFLDARQMWLVFSKRTGQSPSRYRAERRLR